jgi:hypothetical protein
LAVEPKTRLYLSILGSVLLVAAFFAVAVLTPPLHGATEPPHLNVPGERFHGVTQSNLHATVCTVGYTETIRPPVGYTSALKRWILKDRNLPGTVGDYQLDHAVSLELGGAPYSTRNLWMQPESVAHRDDGIENELHRKLCAGTITLRQAQRMELTFKKANG